MDKKYDYLIVGAGLFGAVFAERITAIGKSCLVIDKRPHIGGNVFCEDMDGIQVHKYGPHVFHTHNKEIWQYVNSFASFNRFTYSPLACYQERLFNLPFNMNTFNRLWNVQTPTEAKMKIAEQCEKNADIIEPANLEEQALKTCGEDIYRFFIKGYTEKQWGKSAKELPPFIIKRITFRFIYDNNYFDDPFQGIPVGGYNQIIEKMLNKSEVLLNTDFFRHRAQFIELAPKIVFTGCIDEFFDYRLGKLEYRSLRFEHKRIETENFQGNTVINYTERDVPYTRVIEHKHFDFGQQPFTIVTHEYPATCSEQNEPYYPVNDMPNMKLYNRYLELAATCPNIAFRGRLGQYSYFDMDDTIESALWSVSKELQLFTSF